MYCKVRYDVYLEDNRVQMSHMIALCLIKILDPWREDESIDAVEPTSP